MSAPMLEIANLKTQFVVEGGFTSRQRGVVHAVDGVSLTLHEGEILGLVGESGCGKSTLARTILQVLPSVEGTVLFDGEDLCELSARRLRKLRPALQMVFQDPYASLDPRMTVFSAIAEPLRAYRRVSRRELPERVAGLMERVGLSPRYMRKYPHEFSGGQRQRIAIARALASAPKLIIADEPVSALDVSVQAQILNLLRKLCAEDGLTMLFISHNLAVVGYLAHRIAVMYLGKIVELGDTARVMEHPAHPYTRALLGAAPEIRFDEDSHELALRPLQTIHGDPPSPLDPPKGCRFHPRCPYAVEECSASEPELLPCGPGQQAACFRIDDLPGY